jgi:sodium-independent sulfate anion transporter 11
LQAVILDFSTVDNVDLTSIQYLIDVRNILAGHAAPHTVQWHFSNINNVWAKRALASAGFGYPSFETVDGRPQHFKPIYSLADMSQADPATVRDEQEVSRERRDEEAPRPRQQSIIAVDIQQGNVGGISEQSEKLQVEALEVTEDGKITTEQLARMQTLHGMNRPFFHPDIQSAVTSAVATKVVMEAFEEKASSSG